MSALCLLAPRTSFAQASPKDGRLDGAKDVAARPDDPKARALKHFEHARDLYRDGNYREALAALEAAHGLDPDAKDLVFNLATVSEKLGNIDEALKWMRRYAEMDIDAQERARSESAIRRLEGAKRSLEGAKRDPTPPPPVSKSPKMGRIDGWTIGAGAVAVVGLGVGTVFAIDALGSRPKSGYVTGLNGTYKELLDQSESAHSKAVVADVGFGVFIAGGVAASLLYFLRPAKDTAPKATVADWRGFVAPAAGGAAIVLTRALP